MKELTELTIGLHILIIKLTQLVKHKPNSLLQWRVEVNLRKLTDKKRGSKVSSIVCIKQANFFAIGAQLYWQVKTMPLNFFINGKWILLLYKISLSSIFLNSL